MLVLLQGTRNSYDISSAPGLHLSFGQTLFSRFVREVIQATDANQDGKISRDELARLLKNIGTEITLTDSELQDIFDEFGHSDNDQGEKLLDVMELEHLILNEAKDLKRQKKEE